MQVVEQPVRRRARRWTWNPRRGAARSRRRRTWERNLLPALRGESYLKKLGLLEGPPLSCLSSKLSIERWQSKSEWNVCQHDWTKSQICLDWSRIRDHLKAGTGAPWAAQRREVGCKFAQLRCSVAPDGSFGEEPPTGSDWDIFAKSFPWICLHWEVPLELCWIMRWPVDKLFKVEIHVHQNPFFSSLVRGMLRM